MLDVRDVTTLFNLCQLKFRCLTHGISCEVYDIYNMYIYIYKYHIGFSGGWEGECSALETQTPAPPPRATQNDVAVSQLTISPLPKASTSVKTIHGKKVCEEISNNERLYYLYK